MKGNNHILVTACKILNAFPVHLKKSTFENIETSNLSNLSTALNTLDCKAALTY